MQEIQYTVRQLRKSPAFVTTVIVIFALAIGSNTAVFSIMNAVLFRSLPVRQPEKLFYLSHDTMPSRVGGTGDPDLTFGINIYKVLSKDRSIVSDVVAYVPLSTGKTSIRFGDTPEEAQGDMVNGNFFNALGVGMALGSAFGPEDEDKHSTVVVLRYGYWSRRFAGDRNVIGRTAYIKGLPFTVLGVAAPDFAGVESGGIVTDFWIPLQNRRELPAWGQPEATHSLYGAPNWWQLMLMVRIKPDIATQQAQARLNPLFINAVNETTGTPDASEPRLNLELVPAKGLGASSAGYRTPMKILMGMVGTVLLIACVNIVMLMVARNTVRKREFALRLALGADRWALLRQLICEAALLIGAGTLLGWMFALEATKLLARWSDLQVSLLPDGTVLGFTVILSSLAVVIFGLLPLRIVLKTSVSTMLKGHGSAADGSRYIGRRLLVTLQIVLCMVLLFGAGLLVHTLRNYQETDLGMKADELLVFGVNPTGAQSNGAMLEFYRELLSRLKAIPGVQAVTLVSNRPGTGWSNNTSFHLDGKLLPADPILRSNVVGPNFFSTMGIPVIAGREITEIDSATAPHVVVINETFAKQFFIGQNPIGHFIGSAEHPWTIIGIAKDNKYTKADEDPMPMAWFSHEQFPIVSAMNVEVRTKAKPASLLPSIQRAARDFNQDVALEKPETQREPFEHSFSTPALFARMAVFFGVLAALLVVVGLYGTLAYRVSHRTVEIGVRLALGATRQQVQWSVLSEGLAVLAVGMLVGLPVMIVVSQLMRSLIYQLSPHDPISMAAAMIAVSLLTLAASFVPARKAAKLEPMCALRSE